MKIPLLGIHFKDSDYLDNTNSPISRAIRNVLPANENIEHLNAYKFHYGNDLYSIINGYSPDNFVNDLHNAKYNGFYPFNVVNVIEIKKL